MNIDEAVSHSEILTNETLLSLRIWGLRAIDSKRLLDAELIDEQAFKDCPQIMVLGRRGQPRFFEIPPGREELFRDVAKIVELSDFLRKAIRYRNQPPYDFSVAELVSMSMHLTTAALRQKIRLETINRLIESKPSLQERREKTLRAFATAEIRFPNKGKEFQVKKVADELGLSRRTVYDHLKE